MCKDSVGPSCLALSFASCKYSADNRPHCFYYVIGDVSACEKLLDQFVVFPCTRALVVFFVLTKACSMFGKTE